MLLKLMKLCCHTMGSQAVLNAVVYGDQATITQALTAFRSITQNQPSGSMAGARAAFFAAGRYGTKQDVLDLQMLFKQYLGSGGHTANSHWANDALFGITAGLSGAFANCSVAGMRAIPQFASQFGKSALQRETLVLSAVADMMPYVPACRDQAFELLITDAAMQLWASSGVDATNTIIRQAFPTLSTPSQLSNAQTLLATGQQAGWVTTDAAHVALTAININIDLVNFPGNAARDNAHN